MALFSRHKQKNLGQLLAPQTTIYKNGQAPSSFFSQVQQAKQILLQSSPPKLAELLRDNPKPTPFSRLKLALQGVLPFSVAPSRTQQLTEMVTDEDKEARQEAVRLANRDIGIAIATFGVATIAHLFYWPLALLTLPPLIYLPRNAYKRAYKLLKQGKVGVPTLFCLVIAGALLSGYYWLGSFAMVFGQLARRLKLGVIDESRAKLINIFRQHPKSVWIVVDGVEVLIPFEKLTVGQTVVVNAGEVIPADGVVIDGLATVDQHILTGEARPVEKGVTETVFASTTVLSGRVYIQVEKAGNETTVAQIGNMLNETIDYKASVQLRAEELADKTVLPTFLLSGLALPILGPMGALTVLDSHFRFRMNNLVPLSLMNYLNLASQRGILVKDGRTMDLLNEVDVVVFDKTGTLTEEKPQVRSIYCWAGWGEPEILQYAATAEQKQSHPIAQAILETANQREISLLSFDEADYKIGYGLTVNIDNRLVQVGSRRFMEAGNFALPDQLEAIEAECHAQGHSLVMVAIDQQVVGAIELQPTIRPEAKAIIEQLKQRPNIKATYIISGDQTAPTKKLAEELGIDHYFAETLPEQKAELIGQLQEQGRFVCYVGDGINDAIALKKSQVSVSLRGASTVATDTAQIILMDQSLVGLLTMFEFAEKFHTDTNRSFAIVLLPMAIGIGGAFFLHFTIYHTASLGMAAFCAGIANAMSPLVRDKFNILIDREPNLLGSSNNNAILSTG